MTTDTVRAAMLDAAERLLAASTDYDISTRAVCEAVGVTQPVLYRIFGDKQGLLDAVADAGMERYAAQKAALEKTGDPIADLTAGWDDHMAFARDHPALYQLMFTPRPESGAATYRRVLDLLEATLVRCAAVGALTTDPANAARLILAANVGVALSQIARPRLFSDPRLSHEARDAVFAAVLTEPSPRGQADPVRAAARQLRSQLALSGTTALEDAEAALLDRWLDRIAAEP
ncbi:TetR/AcrR family transcriptional regulator [Actinoplanes aureus]|nr:TetR/AcrR family transcriptional regulator [Actinoplanes aureus]